MNAVLSAVHPRLCGEHSSVSRSKRLPNGSSPPVRGTHVAQNLGGWRFRFIPACAGNTKARQGKARQDWAGFIPACAGNTPRLARLGGQVAVHPRLCGEHNEADTAKVTDTGSSPPVRGTLGPWSKPTPDLRFIPACAGNTDLSHLEAELATVHPRLCGEHLPRRTLPRYPPGSSPPVRGTLCGTPYNTIAERFIPACAGNTYATPYNVDCSERFIPACAGNTTVKDGDH